MRKIVIILSLNCLLGIVCFAQGSVVLDLSKGDGTKAFVLPRVATTASIVAPLNGMLIYDISSNCIKAYQNNVWSGCLGSSTVTNSDALRDALVAGGCTSCAVYDAAAANTWINITAAEYAQIDNAVTVNIAGYNESALTSYGAGTTLSTGVNMTYLPTGPNTTTLPANNYIIAFSAITSAGGGSTTSFLKYSSAPTAGFNTAGVFLSIPNIAGRIYNIIKKPSFVINATSATYIGIYTGSANNWLKYTNASGVTVNYVIGNADPVNSFNGEGHLIQIKGTVTKKW